MPRQSKQEKQLDLDIERLYTKHAQGRNINVMLISKVYKDCRDAHANGQNLEEAVIAAVNKYTNPV